MGLEGFVVSDKTRRAVFLEVAAGERDFGRLVKRQRLIRPAAERALGELESQGLVAREGEGRALSLTPSGEAVARELKRQDLLS